MLTRDIANRVSLLDHRRREFLSLLATGMITRGMIIRSAVAGASLPSLYSCTHRKFLNPDDEVLVSGGQYHTAQAVHDALIIINLNQKDKRVIDLDFLPHQVIIDPHDKYRLFCIQAGGKNACTVDMRSLEVSAQIQCAEGHHFSGYASFDHTGDRLYTVEYDITNRQGLVCTRHPHTFEPVKILPTLGLAPRQCVITRDNRIVINNNGLDMSGFHRPSLVIIDLESGKLARRIQLDNKVMDVAAFTQLDNDDYFIVSGNMSGLDNMPGAVSFATDSSTETLELESLIDKQLAYKIARGTTDVVYDEASGSVFTCHPQSDLITQWDSRTKKMVRHLDLQQPRAISVSLDGDYLIVSYGIKPSMIKLGIRDLEPVAESYVQPTHASGTRMLNWSRELRSIMPKDVYS